MKVEVQNCQPTYTVTLSEDEARLLRLVAHHIGGPFAENNSRLSIGVSSEGQGVEIRDFLRALGSKL